MKKRKLIYSYLILFVTFGGFIAQAEQQDTKQGIRLIPRKMEIEKGNLKIDWVFDMHTLQMHGAESRTYTPILSYGTTQLELPKIIIKGKQRYRADSRAERLNGSAIKPIVNNRQRKGTLVIYTIKEYDKKGVIPYKVMLPYREWMDNAEINLREEIHECCGVLLASALQKNVLKEASDFHPKFRYLVPEGEPEKHRSEIERAYLDFPRGKSAIDPNFRNNRSELDKINRMIALFTSNRDVTVTSIEMRGYASPESSQSFNNDLSSKRAQAMRDYFARISTVPSNLFRTGTGGEDWETLKTLLKNYQVAYKSEILRIIDTEYDLDVREQKIGALGGGAPYRQIYRDLFPKLRRVDCQINYTVRNFTLNEGKDRIQKNPKLLSQNEMYQVARTYPEGSREFNETLIRAREQFPNNDIANLNAAAAALSESNAEVAKEYLDRVQDTDSPEYANCVGVYFILTGNYEESEHYLKKAQKAGSIEATHNLDELEQKRNPASKRKRTPSPERTPSPAGENEDFFYFHNE